MIRHQRHAELGDGGAAEGRPPQALGTGHLPDRRRGAGREGVRSGAARSAC